MGSKRERRLAEGGAVRVRVADVSPITEAMSSTLRREVGALELLRDRLDALGAKVAVEVAAGGSYVVYGDPSAVDARAFDADRVERGLEGAVAGLVGRGGSSEAIVVKSHADALVILR
jgi:hypothetical protein